MEIFNKIEIEKSVLKNLKIVVFDLDGSLLSHDGKIGEETKKLVLQLESLGMHFTFASGRLLSSLKKYAEELKIRTPIISLDGTLISSYESGKILHVSYIKERHVRRALKFADQYLINVALCHADAIYYTEQNSVIPQIMDKFGAPYKEVPSYDNFTSNVLEVVFSGDHKETIKYIKDRMHFPYVVGLNTSFFKSQTYDGIYYLELRRSKTSKGKGLQRLLKKMRIKEQNAAVVGDWYNDISLFKTNALKVTLANGVPEIKKMADMIMQRSNNEDGAAEFLEMVLKAKLDK
jgi:Cof subfamily protein (haloacid dehalogenase superfamily)